MIRILFTLRPSFTSHTCICIRNVYLISKVTFKTICIKVKNDYRSKFSNLSNWKKEAEKSELQRDRTRDLRDTGWMLYQLSYEATHGNEVNLLSSYLS